MKRSIRLAVLALVALAVLALASIAYAAYTTPTLKVTQVGQKTVISVTQAQTDDATARASIYAPAGTIPTLNQAPGTTLGTVTAQVVALALGGALLPLTGEIKVAPPGAVAAASQSACIQTATPAATWLMVLQAAGQTLNVPMYVLTTAGAETAFGPAKIVVCLPPPDVPVASGGATFGAKLFQATFSVNGVFSPVAVGRVDLDLVAVTRRSSARSTLRARSPRRRASRPAACRSSSRRWVSRRRRSRARSPRAVPGSAAPRSTSWRVSRGRA